MVPKSYAAGQGLRIQISVNEQLNIEVSELRKIVGLVAKVKIVPYVLPRVRSANAATDLVHYHSLLSG